MCYCPEKAEKVRRYVFINQKRSQFLDMDNLYASCKVVLDAARKLNLIYDDSPKWIDLHVGQEMSQEHCTIVTIADIQQEKL